MPLVVIAAMAGSAAASGRSAAQEGFLDDLSAQDSARWERSDGWSNGEWIGCSWSGDHVVFADGRMSLVLDDTPGVDRPLSCAEYRAQEHFIMAATRSR